MSLSERSYGGKRFRPRPEIHIEPDKRLVIVATPWGPRSAAKKCIQVIQDYFLSKQQDEEATSPFSRMTCLSPLANDLRVAVKLANDALYNEDNKNEYISAVEIFVAALTTEEVVWVQAGYPSVLLDRPQRNLLPLGSFQDLASEHSANRETLPPLPHKFLGLDPSSDFTVESIRPMPHDRMILLARSDLPPSIFQLPREKRSLNDLTSCLAESDAEMPFWLGVLDLKTS